VGGASRVSQPAGGGRLVGAQWGASSVAAAPGGENFGVVCWHPCQLAANLAPGGSTSLVDARSAPLPEARH
jgi:hypothetical protein